MIAAERETSVAYTDADAEVLIYTCRRSDISRLRGKLGRGVRQVELGHHADGTPFARFAVPLDRFNLAGAVKRVAAVATGGATSDAREDTPPRGADSEVIPTDPTSDLTPGPNLPGTPPGTMFFDAQGWMDRMASAYAADLRRIARALADVVDSNGQVEASSATVAKLARAAGLHVNRTQEVLDQLRDMRAIEHLPRRDGEPAMWQLVAAQPVTVRIA